MADSYVEFSVTDLVVPFASDYQTSAIAYGVLAMWGLVIVESTSLAMKRLPRTVWRGIHRTSALTFWLSSLHGIYAGTDTANPLYAVASIIAVVLVPITLGYRLLTRNTARRQRSDPSSPRVLRTDRSAR